MENEMLFWKKEFERMVQSRAEILAEYDTLLRLCEQMIEFLPKDSFERKHFEESLKRFE